MLIDRTHRSWALATAAALGVATAIYVPYAATAAAGARGSTPLGMAYGIVGFAMMLFAGLLSVRKAFPIWRIGRAQAWMRGHLWIGTLSFPLIAFHAGLTFGGGALTRVLMSLFVVVLVSGVAGAAVQHVLPRLMFERVPMETIYEEIPHVREQLVAEADAIVADLSGEGAPLRDFYLQEIRPFVLGPAAAHWLADEGRAQVRFSHLQTVLPPPFREAVENLASICEEERQLTRQLRMHRLLHGWLLVHVPLSFALLALSAVHVVMALRY
jgi:hypothetical protein